MHNTVAVVVALLVSGVVCLLIELPRRRALAPYWTRRCQGREWRVRFGRGAKTDVREFLSLVVDSFGFGRRRRLWFGPDDSLFAIYRACNPRPGWPDACELEAFSKLLSARYGIDLSSIWHEQLTLGEIFERTSAASTAQADVRRALWHHA